MTKRSFPSPYQEHYSARWVTNLKVRVTCSRGELNLFMTADLMASGLSFSRGADGSLIARDWGNMWETVWYRFKPWKE